MDATNLIQQRDFRKLSDLENTDSFTDGKRDVYKRFKISSKEVIKQEETIQKQYSLNESELIRQARITSLSHWPHFTPSCEAMISAGWFSCNFNDRVICIYCNTICQTWTTIDNPTEVHRQLAPQCSFVLSMASIQSTPKIINDTLHEKFEPSHPSMSEISRREATYSKGTWTESSPSVENLVRAGFFFTGVSNQVTCFYCNGSLHKWTPHDNPMIEHARWFPHCVYAKHLCGDKLYAKIQASKKAIPKQNQINESQLNSLVAARIDLPVVRRLSSQYQLAIIKRCIENQLRIKKDDFKSDTDLSVACLILQKQIDHIQGCKNKIIVPSQRQKLENSPSTARQSLGECLICLIEENQLACMPCGHLCACVPCGYALNSCPVCRQQLRSFMRINN
ncbi:unnamed protein product [Rotaria magnacalcarata]|uniref:RING-type domain-containing protein n=5 Tax=Rotaria magnacalcarata TaxID=392030 RepID=A0A816Y7K9_9BILA|nr:unnamed protein product [Rotaria magnacalcarata]CAF1645438.1 unnamed protein product [Rotaria magnacalcarata]CAF1980005.1 unnamed protein product [Rotaria magnacalcarata]CAF2155298.1 unnamed protein product [Rotaria magnacalcarata]CAF3880715.1 unnamed protein product [Rotaria magnacalcarata]